MATTCAKDGTQEDVDVSRKAFISQEAQLTLDYQRDKVINDCVSGENLTYEKAKEALIANYIEGKSPDQWPMDQIKEAVERLEYERKAELRQKIARQYGDDKKGLQKTLNELDRSQPERDVKEVKSSKIDRRQQQRPGVFDAYGRKDYLDKDATRIVENKSFRAGTVSPRPREHDRIIQMKEDSSVQSVHVHKHEDGLTISTLYKDGRRDNFDIARGVQQKYNVTIVTDE